MSANNYEPYSSGIAAENLEDGTISLSVFPIKVLTMADGEVVDAIGEIEESYVDSRGIAHSTRMQYSNSITATWINFGDANLMTPPNVRRGAKVMLYRAANRDQFYWTTINSMENYQKLERKVWAYSNTRDESVDYTKDAGHAWTQEINTKEKKVSFIHTTRSDGEEWSYDVDLDVKQGVYRIEDSIGNKIYLDSKNHVIRQQTTEGAFIEINKNDITISCKNLKIIAEESITESTKSKSGSYKSWNTHADGFTHVGMTTIKGNANITGGDTSIAGKNFLSHIHHNGRYPTGSVY